MPNSINLEKNYNAKTDEYSNGDYSHNYKRGSDPQTEARISEANEKALGNLENGLIFMRDEAGNGFRDCTAKQQLQILSQRTDLVRPVLKNGSFTETEFRHLEKSTIKSIIEIYFPNMKPGAQNQLSGYKTKSQSN